MTPINIEEMLLLIEDAIYTAEPLREALIQFDPKVYVNLGPAGEDVLKLSRLVADATLAYADLIERLVFKIQGGVDPTSAEHLEKHKLGTRETLYSALLATLIRDTYDAWDACSVGVAQLGDTIVVIKSKKNEFEGLAAKYRKAQQRPEFEEDKEFFKRQVKRALVN